MFITDAQPRRPMAVTAYYLGRPAELYRRRYRRRSVTIVAIS